MKTTVNQSACVMFFLIIGVSCLDNDEEPIEIKKIIGREYASNTELFIKKKL